MSENINSISDLEPLISELDLVQANTEEYYGEIADQPIALTILSGNPLTIMFKIRLNSEDKYNLEYDEALLELIEKQKINATVENGYGWLTLYHLSDLTVKDILNLLVHFVLTIKNNNLNLGLECAVCKDSNSAEIYYSDGTINRLCPNCLEAKVQQQADRDKKFITISGSSLLFNVLGIMGFAFVWMLIWFLYDYMFQLYGRDTIVVSDIAIGLGVLISISALTITIGFPIRKFEIQNKIFLIVTASIIAALSFVLGEILLYTVWLFEEIKVIDIVSSIRYFIFVWRSEPTIGSVIKIILVIGSVIGVCLIAKKKKANIRI